MFEIVRDINTPTDEIKVWRYMDLAKLVSILETEMLFFPTIACLRNSADPWEGSYKNFEAAQRVGGTEESYQLYKKFRFPIQTETASKQTAVSCWYINEHESNAMWKSYVKGNEGIAIQTTFGDLKVAFDDQRPNWPELGGNFAGQKIPLIAGEVEYIDWEQPQPNVNSLKQFFFKGNSFAHEQELRLLAKLAMLPGSPHIGADLRAYNKNPTDEAFLGLSNNVLEQIQKTNGVSIPVNLDKLIQNIYVVPSAATWFVELLEKIKARYAVSASIKWSDWMTKSPEY